jgi:D-beta-D-heptose 7-phosphate kinase / D-beta-D-heptose 1-phosphate adenosyltransferase
MKDELIRLIENFTKLKILVIGDAILDTYVKGNPDRVCREAPVLVFNVDEQEYQCGGAANTAINVATLGAQSYYLTVLGKDASSKELIDILKKNKVHTDYILRDKSRVTIAKKRITAASHILMRVDEGTTTEISETCEKELLKNVSELLPQIDAIILSDYGFGVITNNIVKEIKALAATHHKAVIVDARDLSKYKTLKPEAVKPNYEETIKLLNIEKLTQDRDKQILQHGKKLHKITGANKVAVTLDADGVLLFEEGKEPYRLLCVPQDNKNAIGAGDTFISAMTMALALKANGATAAEIASAAAAVVVRKDGTVGCTNQELKSYFNSVPKYILDNTELADIVKDLRKSGKKIVFTNGCFDIIHKGHITLLNKAREAGDVLIVGVNSDASIRKLKGAERPINNLEDRLTVLAGLQSVDYLISFEEESPVQLIKAVHPDVFVKGGNYTENTIPEAPLLKRLSITVKIVPYKEEHATTQIINKIRDKNREPELELQDEDYLKEGRMN